jgi:hypothetical protein
MNFQEKNVLVEALFVCVCVGKMALTLGQADLFCSQINSLLILIGGSVN